MKIKIYRNTARIGSNFSKLVLQIGFTAICFGSKRIDDKCGYRIGLFAPIKFRGRYWYRLGFYFHRPMYISPTKR